MKQTDIMSVRRAVGANVGRRVKLRANRGRHKFTCAMGTITESYPSIFTVRLDSNEEAKSRLVSFSYIDILTKDVQLVLCKDA